MTTPTMVYRPFKDGADTAKCIENERGKWEWQIVYLDDSEGPSDGWQATPFGVVSAPETEKPKRGKMKLPVEPDVTEETDGNSN